MAASSFPGLSPAAPEIPGSDPSAQAVAAEVAHLLATGDRETGTRLARRPDAVTVVLGEILRQATRPPAASAQETAATGGRVSVYWFLSVPWDEMVGLTGAHVAVLWATVSAQPWSGLTLQRFVEALAPLRRAPPATLDHWLQSSIRGIRWTAVTHGQPSGAQLEALASREQDEAVLVALYAHPALRVPTEEWSQHLLALRAQGRDFIETTLGPPVPAAVAALNGEAVGRILLSRDDTPWATVVELLATGDDWVDELLTSPPERVRVRLAELGREPRLASHHRALAAQEHALQPDVEGPALLDALEHLPVHATLDLAGTYTERWPDVAQALGALDPDAGRATLARLLRVAPRAIRLQLLALRATLWPAPRAGGPTPRPARP